MIMGLLLGVYGLFYAVIAVFGLKKRKNQFPETRPRQRIAALVAARNEETVIGQLVHSLVSQRYPKELSAVIVVPNNCTDDTEGAARRAGARILHVDRDVHSKGEALESAFRQLLAQDEFDAFCVFDADNIADPNFFQAVNDALNAGARIAQGYRDSKNPHANWVSGASSVFYWFMDRLYNHARRTLGTSAALNGTGFMVSASLLRETGYDIHSLTEDLEYTAQCALRGERVYWMDNAITYDEQPERLRDALVQRMRWFSGAYQCKKYYFKQLLKKHSFPCVDMALVFGSVYFMVLGLLPLIMSAVSMIVYMAHTPEYVLPMLLLAAGSGLLSILAMQAFAILICLLERKRLKPMARAIVLYPLFMALWMLANWASILSGPPKWKAIQHKAQTPDMEREMGGNA